MTYSYLNIQKQKNKQILNYIKHEKSTITSKRDTHSSYWTGDYYLLFHLLFHFFIISLRLEKWNRILGIICLLISTLTRIKLYYQKASVRTDAGQMPDRCSFFNTV